MPAINVNGLRSSGLIPAVSAVIPNCNQACLLSGTGMIATNLADLPY